MKIQIGGLSEGLHHYRFTVQPEVLELGTAFHHTVVVETTLDKSPNQILVTSSIRTVGTFACDRCVSDFEEELTPSYRLFYMMEGAETAHLDPVEFQMLSPSQNIIDIADDVRQTLLLAIPLKLLCKESCKGLCPHCGKNLNSGACSCKEEELDPRWDELRRLQNNY
ncbi:MAG: hypothetical protein C4326_02630 [Ignavibacteria bacterium]